MAKASYKPLQMLKKEDPLAVLRQATQERAAEAAILGVEEKQAVSSPAQTFQVVEKPQPQVEETPTASDQLRNLQPTTSIAPVKPLARTLNPTRNTFYLYPEDLTRLRMLSGYASTTHGIRTNDSVIVRAALSLVESDVRFMHALEEAMQSDRRKTKV